MLSRIQFLSLFFAALLWNACSTNAGTEIPENLDEIKFSATDAYDSTMFAFSTDYASGGILYMGAVLGDTTGLADTGVVDLGSSATLHFSDDLLFVLHDGYSLLSSDNLEVLDPTDGFATIAQWSTGNGTNPQSVVATDGRAFVSLYNPKADTTNVDSNGDAGDVIEINLADGSITNRYAFANDLQDDDAQAANAHPLILSGSKLYVGIQDLNPNTFEADAPGKIGVIDISENAIEEVLTLQGRNPMNLAVSDDGKLLFVAEMATYDFTTFTFNTATEFGGIEIIDLESLSTIAFLKDEDLGGYIENVATYDGQVYVHVSNDDSGLYTSHILQIPQTATSADASEIFVDLGTDIRALSLNAGYLWVSTRNAESGNPEIRVFDAKTGEQVGDTLSPTASAMSFAGVE